jgi:hypothetical protein
LINPGEHFNRVLSVLSKWFLCNNCPFTYRINFQNKVHVYSNAFQFISAARSRVIPAAEVCAVPALIKHSGVAAA